MTKQDLVRDIVMNLGRRDPSDNSKSANFVQLFIPVAFEGQLVARPVRFSLSSQLLFIDAHFQHHGDAEDALVEVGVWGLGGNGEEFSFRTVLNHDLVISNTKAFLELLEDSVIRAARIERDFLGEIRFTFSSADAFRPISEFQNNLGSFVPESLDSEPAAVVENPTGWDGIFDVLPDNSDLKELVANFGVKYRLLQQLSSSAFTGDSGTSDAYYVMLKASLTYSAIEAWEKIGGRGAFKLISTATAANLRDNSTWIHFRDRLSASIQSTQLKSAVENLMGGATDDLRPMLEAVRNGFFHPRLNATNSSLSAHKDLRTLLLQIADAARELLSREFEQWAQQVSRWHELMETADDDDMEAAKELSVVGGYPRVAIETEFRVQLTEDQWGILVGEVFQEDEWTIEETITEVMQNLPSYEAEHSAWQEQVREARSQQSGE